MAFDAGQKVTLPRAAASSKTPEALLPMAESSGAGMRRKMCKSTVNSSSRITVFRRHQSDVQHGAILSKLSALHQQSVYFAK